MNYQKTRLRQKAIWEEGVMTLLTEGPLRGRKKWYTTMTETLTWKTDSDMPALISLYIKFFLIVICTTLFACKAIEPKIIRSHRPYSWVELSTQIGVVRGVVVNEAPEVIQSEKYYSRAYPYEVIFFTREGAYKFQFDWRGGVVDSCFESNNIRQEGTIESVTEIRKEAKTFENRGSEVSLGKRDQEATLKVINNAYRRK